MEQVAVTEKLEDVRPTDEQASAFLNGDRAAVEQQQEQPQAKEKAEATPPAASSTPPVQEKTETQKILEELNRVKSELGQIRKRSLESPKPRQEQMTPQALAKLTPEQRAEWEALFEETFQTKYGKDLEEIRSDRQNREIAAQIQSIEAYAKTLTGDLHKELDPIMGELYEQIRQKAEEGDEEAQQDLYEIKHTRAGIRDLVARARQQYSQTLEAKGEAAKATQAAAAKKAGVTLGSTPAAAPTPDVLKNLPDDPAEAAKILKKELQKRGVL